ncbi:MAG: hypothetical protein K9N35_08550 [Candidatus Marinimicrobia bacterium]|nr:hypothetical protein [Candidatus Neomarinimicrobiota bacterium]
MNYLTELIPDNLFPSLPLIGLYAESHFRFRIPFSRYFKREPELIFDVPWRLQPGETPTLFLVIKDAHRFPVLLKRVEVSVQHGGETIFDQAWDLDQEVHDRQLEIEFHLKTTDTLAGEMDIIPRLSYSVNGKDRCMEIDNYALLPKPPLRITFSKEPMPLLPGWQSGDTHLHSSLTNDQVEFGASLGVIRKAAQLMGLNFITATDHSYDLDDDPEDYTKNDPELCKWKSSRELIKEMNRTHPLTIIPGEEISVSNARGSNVHFLHYNDSKYFPGSGDGGEEWTKLHSQLGIEDVLENRSQNTVSVGAHSVYRFPWLTRLLLNRGHWEAADHERTGLDGVQIICGTPASGSFQDSRQAWIDTLLKGFKLGVYGGSDGHGNFNRNWHVKLPALTLGLSEDQIFGQSRTLIKSATTGVNDLIQAMKTRRTALTTGPVGDLMIEFGDQHAEIGDTLGVSKGAELQITMLGLSSDEFGAEMDVTLYCGRLSRLEESILYHGSDHRGQFELQLSHTAEDSGYVRLEISSEGSRWPGVFVSSPIWIDIA